MMGLVSCTFFGLDAHGDGIELREAMDEAALLPLGYVLD
jgi:hypothetical protein